MYSRLMVKILTVYHRIVEVRARRRFLSFWVNWLWQKTAETRSKLEWVFYWLQTDKDFFNTYLKIQWSIGFPWNKTQKEKHTFKEIKQVASRGIV